MGVAKGKKKIQLLDSGHHGLEDLASHMRDDHLQWGVLRVYGVDERGGVTSKRAKYCFVTWVGSGIGFMQKPSIHAIINGLAFGAGAGGAAGDPGDLPRRARAALSGQGAVPSAHVLRQDDVVVLGDLNYRLEGAADAAAVAQMVAEGRIEELRAFDQLEGERRAGRPFCCVTNLPI